MTEPRIPMEYSIAPNDEQTADTWICKNCKATEVIKRDDNAILHKSRIVTNHTREVCIANLTQLLQDFRGKIDQGLHIVDLLDARLEMSLLNLSVPDDRAEDTADRAATEVGSTISEAIGNFVIGRAVRIGMIMDLRDERKS